MSGPTLPIRSSRRRFLALGLAASAAAGPALSARAQDPVGSGPLDEPPQPPLPDAESGVRPLPEPAPALGPYLARPSTTRMSVWFESDAGSPDVAEAHGQHDGHRTVAVFEEIDRGLFLATFTNLTPDTAYSYRFVDASGAVHASSFRTFPEEHGEAHVIFGADIHPWSAPHAIFDRITDESPHLYVGLGDQIYADVEPETIPAPTAAGYADLYRRSWAAPAIARCFRRVPAAFVWDDHEIWNDFDGSDFHERFLAARIAYRRYQRSRSSGSTPWTVLRVGAAEIFVLDTRTHRDPNGMDDGPDKTMLGVPQRDALLEFIATSRAGLRIIASPTPFHRYVTTGRDGWAHGFPTERATIFQAIDAHDPRTVLLATGDQHWPGVFSHSLPSGAHVIELQCTPTSAFFRAKPLEVGPDAWYVDADHNGYGSLRIDGSGPEVRARFAWTDEAGNERYVLEHPTMPRTPTTSVETEGDGPV